MAPEKVSVAIWIIWQWKNWKSVNIRLSCRKSTVSLRECFFQCRRIIAAATFDAILNITVTVACWKVRPRGNCCRRCEPSNHVEHFYSKPVNFSWKRYGACPLGNIAEFEKQQQRRWRKLFVRKQRVQLASQCVYSKPKAVGGRREETREHVSAIRCSEWPSQNYYAYTMDWVVEVDGSPRHRCDLRWANRHSCQGVQSETQMEPDRTLVGWF